MNKNILTLFGLATILAVSVNSCRDKVKDTEKPVITLETPKQNETITLGTGTTVNIKFTATDNTELHDVTANVYDAIGVNVFTKSEHAHKKTYNFSKTFTPSGITGPTPYVLKIQASDHSDNKNDVIVPFIVKP